MTKTSNPIIFFGSGPVAAQSLELLTKNFQIEAVVTKPKPAHHRGNFPVIDIAEKLNLPVFTVSNKAELSELVAKNPFQSRLGVLIDFGIIVSQDVIDYFPLGIVNSHFSLLPEWRGADPITFSILSGQKQTGVSLMLLVEAMDEGPLLAQSPYDIPEKYTTPDLTEALVQVSDETLTSILPLYLKGEIESAPQLAVTMAQSKEPTYSRKLIKDDGIIDWNKPANQLEREIRAFTGWPQSRTRLADREVVLTSAHVEPNTESRVQSPEIGKPFVTEDKKVAVLTGKNLLIIDKLKPAGKPEMTAQAFLAGNKL